MKYNMRITTLVGSKLGNRLIRVGFENPNGPPHKEFACECSGIVAAQEVSAFTSKILGHAKFEFDALKERHAELKEDFEQFKMMSEIEPNALRQAHLGKDIKIEKLVKENAELKDEFSRVRRTLELRTNNHKEVTDRMQKENLRLLAVADTLRKQVRSLEAQTKRAPESPTDALYREFYNLVENLLDPDHSGNGSSMPWTTDKEFTDLVKFVVSSVYIDMRAKINDPDKFVFGETPPESETPPENAWGTAPVDKAHAKKGLEDLIGELTKLTKPAQAPTLAEALRRAYKNGQALESNAHNTGGAM